MIVKGIVAVTSTVENTTSKTLELLANTTGWMIEE